MHPGGRGSAGVADDRVGKHRRLAFAGGVVRRDAVAVAVAREHVGIHQQRSAAVGRLYPHIEDATVYVAVDHVSVAAGAGESQIDAGLAGVYALITGRIGIPHIAFKAAVRQRRERDRHVGPSAVASVLKFGTDADGIGRVRRELVGPQIPPASPGSVEILFGRVAAGGGFRMVLFRVRHRVPLHSDYAAVCRRGQPRNNGRHELRFGTDRGHGARAARAAGVHSVDAVAVPLSDFHVRIGKDGLGETFGDGLGGIVEV